MFNLYLQLCAHHEPKRRRKTVVERGFLKAVPISTPLAPMCWTIRPVKVAHRVAGQANAALKGHRLVNPTKFAPTPPICTDTSFGDFAVPAGGPLDRPRHRATQPRRGRSNAGYPAATIALTLDQANPRRRATKQAKPG